MQSSLHSPNQAIPEAAQTPSIQAIPEAVQTTYKLSGAMRFHRRFHRSMYNESLSGENIDENAFPKLRLLSSIWMKKIVVIVNNILGITISVVLGIAAIFTNETQKQYFFSLIAFWIIYNLWAYDIVMIMYFTLKVEPLEVSDSLESLTRINTVWSQRSWFLVTWPFAAYVSAAVYHSKIRGSFTISDLVKLFKSAPS